VKRLRHFEKKRLLGAPTVTGVIDFGRRNYKLIKAVVLSTEYAMWKPATGTVLCLLVIGLPFAADWASPSLYIEGTYAFVGQANGSSHAFRSKNCVFGRARNVSDGIADCVQKDIAKVVSPEAAMLAPIFLRVPLRATSAKFSFYSAVVNAADRSHPQKYGGRSVFAQDYYLRS